MSDPKPRPKPRKDAAKATVTRKHRWVLAPLGFRIDAAFRAHNPPPDRTRCCSLCGLVQTHSPDSHGDKIRWPECSPCPGKKEPQ